MEDPGREARLAIASLLMEAEDVRRNLLLPDPDPASPARHDLDASRRALGGDEPVARVIRLADMWTLVIAEHLRGIGVLLRDATTVFPIFPLLRAAIEHAAWVCWILDPDVDSRQRAKRAALAQLRSDQEIVGVAKLWAGAATVGHRQAKEQLNRTRQAAERDFGDLDRQVPTIEGEKVATPTEAIDHFGRCLGDSRQWRGTYAYLCGTATHPSQNAFEFVEVDAEGKPNLTLTHDFVSRMVRVGLVAFLHSLSHVTGYLGWPRDAMRSYEEKASSVLATYDQSV